MKPRRTKIELLFYADVSNELSFIESFWFGRVRRRKSETKPGGKIQGWSGNVAGFMRLKLYKTRKEF